MGEWDERSEWLQHAGASPDGRQREQAPALHMERGQRTLVDVGYSEERSFDCVPRRAHTARKRKARDFAQDDNK